MSFDYNPLKHIEIVDDLPVLGYSNNNDPETYAIYCHSCGSSNNRVKKTAPIGTAFEIMREHVRNSHNRVSEDFKDWPIY